MSRTGEDKLRSGEHLILRQKIIGCIRIDTGYDAKISGGNSDCKIVVLLCLLMVPHKIYMCLVHVLVDIQCIVWLYGIVIVWCCLVLDY